MMTIRNRHTKQVIATLDDDGVLTFKDAQGNPEHYRDIEAVNEESLNASRNPDEV